MAGSVRGWVAAVRSLPSTLDRTLVPPITGAYAAFDGLVQIGPAGFVLWMAAVSRATQVEPFHVPHAVVVTAVVGLALLVAAALVLSEHPLGLPAGIGYWLYRAREAWQGDELFATVPELPLSLAAVALLAWRYEAFVDGVDA